jgi:TPR repeat protein
VSSFYFLNPRVPAADTAARQMLEAYMSTYAAKAKPGDPVMQGASVALATMLEDGRGGTKDIDRAVQIYTDTVRKSHLTCEPEAADALKRLGKPIPEGLGAPCAQQKPVNPLEQ